MDKARFEEEFGDAADEARALVESYGSSRRHRRVADVRTALVILADGDVDYLRWLIEVADRDGPKVIRWAKTPDASDAERNRDELRHSFRLYACYAVVALLLTGFALVTEGLARVAAGVGAVLVGAAVVWSVTIVGGIGLLLGAVGALSDEDDRGRE